jgi:hypothetical protein
MRSLPSENLKTNHQPSKAETRTIPLPSAPKRDVALICLPSGGKAKLSDCFGHWAPASHLWLEHREIALHERAAVAGCTGTETIASLLFGRVNIRSLGRSICGRWQAEWDRREELFDASVEALIARPVRSVHDLVELVEARTHRTTLAARREALRQRSEVPRA